jgi:hypothetical protein
MIYLVTYKNTLRDYPVAVYQTLEEAENYIKEQEDSEDYSIVKTEFGEDLD